MSSARGRKNAYKYLEQTRKIFGGIKNHPDALRDLGIGILDLRRSVTYSLSAHLSLNERGAVEFFRRARIGRRAERVLVTLSRGERRHASRTSSFCISALRSRSGYVLATREDGCFRVACGAGRARARRERSVHRSISGDNRPIFVERSIRSFELVYR